MTSCPECGATVTAEVDFCPQCDAYLAWEKPGGGKPAGRVPRRSASAPTTPPDVESPRPAAATTTTEAAPVAPAPKAEEPKPAASLPIITIPSWPFDDESPSAAAADGDPVAMLPGRAVPKAPTTGAGPVAARASDGSGVRCAACGASNTVGRHFCTSCGAEIVAAPAPARSTTPAPARATSAYRPRSNVGRIVAVLVVVAVVLAVLIGGFVLREPLGAFAAAALDRVVGVSAVNPSRITASGAAEGHPAAAAHDGASNIAWEAATPGPAIGQSLTFSFDRPFRLVVLQVLPGAATDQQTFLKSGRPLELRLTIGRAGSPSIERTMRLDDEAGPQRLDLGIDAVTSVKATIVRSQVPQGAGVAIAEVEFSGR